jgi:hypothetical protein
MSCIIITMCHTPARILYSMSDLGGMQANVMMNVCQGVDFSCGRWAQAECRHKSRVGAAWCWLQARAKLEAAQERHKLEVALAGQVGPGTYAWSGSYLVLGNARTCVLGTNTSERHVSSYTERPTIDVAPTCCGTLQDSCSHHLYVFPQGAEGYKREVDKLQAELRDYRSRATVSAWCLLLVLVLVVKAMCCSCSHPLQHWVAERQGLP